MCLTMHGNMSVSTENKTSFACCGHCKCTCSHARRNSQPRRIEPIQITTESLFSKIAFLDPKKDIRTKFAQQLIVNHESIELMAVYSKVFLALKGPLIFLAN